MTQIDLILQQKIWKEEQLSTSNQNQSRRKHHMNVRENKVVDQKREDTMIKLNTKEETKSKNSILLLLQVNLRNIRN